MADTILLKTAKSVYRADTAPSRGDWGSLPQTEQRRYETMAAAALSVALRLNYEEESELVLSLPSS